MDRKKWKDAALLLPLAVQLGFLVWLTFARHTATVDSDAGRLYAHAAAIWDAKTLFVPDWIYPTTLELDCALLFALPFYGLTKNLLIAFACADVVVYLLLVLLCFGLAARLLPDRRKIIQGGGTGKFAGPHPVCGGCAVL